MRKSKSERERKRGSMSRSSFRLSLPFLHSLIGGINTLLTRRLSRTTEWALFLLFVKLKLVGATQSGHHLDGREAARERHQKWITYGKPKAGREITTSTNYVCRHPVASSPTAFALTRVNWLAIISSLSFGFRWKFLMLSKHTVFVIHLKINVTI